MDDLGVPQVYENPHIMSIKVNKVLCMTPSIHQDLSRPASCSWLRSGAHMRFAKVAAA